MKKIYTPEEALEVLQERRFDPITEAEQEALLNFQQQTKTPLTDNEAEILQQIQSGQTGIIMRQQ